METQMSTLKLQAKQRLLASSTYDQPSQPVSNSTFYASVDDDSKRVIETELGDARRGHAAAKARGHTDAVTAYENLISELERANAPMTANQTETLVANDTSDFEGLSVANPSDDPAPQSDAESADDVILSSDTDTKQMPCLLESEESEDTDELDPADPNGVDVLKQDTTASRFFTEAELRAAGKRIRAEMEAKAGRALSDEELHAMMNQRALASTEDPISDGAAFDMLIDGDDEEDEPLVQELTNNDGGVEPPIDQPLLRDDVTQGPPTI
jgi:hypothetical protein